MVLALGTEEFVMRLAGLVEVLSASALGSFLLLLACTQPSAPGGVSFAEVCSGSVPADAAKEPIFTPPLLAMQLDGKAYSLYRSADGREVTIAGLRNGCLLRASSDTEPVEQDRDWQNFGPERFLSGPYEPQVRANSFQQQETLWCNNNMDAFVADFVATRPFSPEEIGEIATTSAAGDRNFCISLIDNDTTIIALRSGAHRYAAWLVLGRAFYGEIE